MTRTRLVLAYIAAHPSGVSRAMVRREFDFDRPALSSVLGELVRSGMVVREGAPRAGIYKPGRKPKLARYATDEERKAAQRETRRKRQPRINAQNRARRAKDKAAAEKAAAREAAKRARAQERAREKARKQAERDVARAKAREDAQQARARRLAELKEQRRMSADRAPYQPREIATAPIKETLPDTSAWIAANADKYERLPVGAASKKNRLRFNAWRYA